MLKMRISSVTKRGVIVWARHVLPAAVSLVLILLAAPVASAQDINGDGRVDAVFTQKQRFNQVCFGNGTGAFTTCSDLIGAGQFQLTAQINTTSSVLVDWDADGDLDIVLAMEGRSSVVCYNDGGGQFNAGLGCVEVFGYNTFPYNTQDVVVGDLDGDGAPDLVFANGGNAGLALNQPNVVCLGFNSGASACHTFGTADAASTGVALGDVDNDGDLDVLVSNRGTLNVVCLNGGRNANGMVFDCRLIPQAANVSATKVSNAVAVGHLPPSFGQMPDALLDVAFANTGKNEVCFGTGNWAGTGVGFNCLGLDAVTSYTFSDEAAQSVDVAIGNFMTHPTASAYNGDEIVFANADSPNVRCFGTFTCTFAFQPSQTVTVNIGGINYQVSEPIAEFSTSVAIRDINIDGKLDVVVANDGISRTSIDAYCCAAPTVVANSLLHPSSVTLSGGTVGPSADTAPPAFFGATAFTVEATGPGGAVAQFTVTAVDVEDGSRPVTCAPASGGLFPLGTTTVTCTAADTTGNQGTASFGVTVSDTTGPLVIVPANVSVVAPAGQATTAVTFSVSAFDVVDGPVSAFCYNPATNSGVASGAQLPGGTMSLACGANDSRLNYGESYFTITVRTDIDSDGILDDVDLDDDGDGIADTVDSQPLVSSNVYRFDGTNTGTVTRNGWTVSIDPTLVGSTYQLRVTLGGTGTAPAAIQTNCGDFFKQLQLNAAGDILEWRCVNNFPTKSSLAVNFVSGTGAYWKTVSGVWVQMTPTAPNTGVTAGSPVAAHATNTSPVLVTILDEALGVIGSFSLDPEESVDVEVVAGAGNEPVLQLELLNGGPDGTVAVTLFGQAVTLDGSGPATFDLSPDLTAPAIAAQVSGTLGNNGYYVSDVTVTWTVTDAESAATPTGCETQSVVQDTTGVTFTCSAVSEGGTASASVTIKRDATAPVITVPADITSPATGTSGAVITYAATVQDLLDSTPTLSCAPASGSTFTTGATTVVCTASDDAGNSSGRSFVVTVEATTTATPGRMKGEGFVRSGGKRYEFDMDVREGARGEQARFRLEVRDESGRGRGRDRGDSFVSTSVTSVTFSDDPAHRPGHRKGPQVDSVLFSGTGKWNGAGGYTHEVFAEDRGEPGRHRESVRITIRNSGGAVVAFVEGELSGGNIQSLRIKH